ncbi:hypothetical protein COLO4_16351 [Corchorus olitorius]|uniref:Uncharacterized protein n=1 Tax=Corchorus olitorius TaxID=93759 RepID=A0A1R3JHQ9_9ROSI|nr:hypothetical protein COLO4_16351 [Corchorus olitorius]
MDQSKLPKAKGNQPDTDNMVSSLSPCGSFPLLKFKLLLGQRHLASTCVYCGNVLLCGNASMTMCLMAA